MTQDEWKGRIDWMLAHAKGNATRTETLMLEAALMQGRETARLADAQEASVRAATGIPHP